MVTITQLASTRQKPISEIHSSQPMRNLAALVLVQLTLTPKLLCIIATTEEFGKNHWRIHKCSSAWLQLYAWWGRKLIFASLSVHMIKKIRLLFKEGQFMCYSYDNLSQYFEKAGMTQPKQESLISRREHYELHYTSSYQQSFCRQLQHISRIHQSATNQTHERSPLLSQSPVSILLQVGSPIQKGIAHGENSEEEHWADVFFSTKRQIMKPSYMGLHLISIMNKIMEKSREKDCCTNAR